MGITVSYRGRLADLTRVEDFEDRVLDFALDVGGMAQIWRTQADDNPQRMVRGVILSLAPGQESTSLLLSPEGWLIGLVDIENAERGALKEPPWCFTKTQFGPLEGHVALVEMFQALQSEFMPELEVLDEGGYWETRDLAELERRRRFLKQAIDGLAEGLQRHGLSREAAEDPDILCKRIERIAAQVHRILRRPAEHPPPEFPDEDESPGAAPDPATTEAHWDELFKHNRRQQERLQRAHEERRSAGQDDDAAFEGALEDLGLEVPREDEEDDEPWRGEDDGEQLDEPWRSDEAETLSASDGDSASALAWEKEERHPLLQRASELGKGLHTVFQGAESRFEASLSTLFQGMGDAMGGLAQALSDRDDEPDDPDAYGLRVTQLKRALRGAAFARGALFLLRPATTAETFHELHGALGQFERDIMQALSRLRSEWSRDD
jgi:hypothetical protein